MAKCQLHAMVFLRTEMPYEFLRHPYVLRGLQSSGRKKNVGADHKVGAQNMARRSVRRIPRPHILVVALHGQCKNSVSTVCPNRWFSSMEQHPEGIVVVAAVTTNINSPVPPSIFSFPLLLSWLFLIGYNNGGDQFRFFVRIKWNRVTGT
jgi:hypothetical protein